MASVNDFEQQSESVDGKKIITAAKDDSESSIDQSKDLEKTVLMGPREILPLNLLYAERLRTRIGGASWSSLSF